MIFILILSFIFGLVLGSFINVIAYRLPLTLQYNWQKSCLNYLKIEQKTQSDPPYNSCFNLLGIRSHCPDCHQKIAFYHNIPIISFVFLRGRCHSCHKKISWLYPITELISAILFTLIIIKFGFSIATLFSLIFVFALITLAIIDIRTQLLPDIITLPLIWLGLMVNNFSYFTSLTLALWGAIIGYLILWFVYIIYKLLRHCDGLGFGDLKCLSAIGAWLGLNAILPTLVIASISALISVLIIKFSEILIQKAKPNYKPKLTNQIVFGPFLAFASIFILFWHNDPILTSISVTSIM
ncbi:prepilin peptidase [Thiotrichales bacterium 19S3-7]|nr:prepilin peptidase [Thiotrichales bacterium 19S3-7]MCF6802217.1 prepilin peptidase [Thiotrichales bacterium 19S3-11]